MIYPIWFIIGYIFNYISVMSLNKDASSFSAMIISVALCWIGPFAIINVLGLMLLKVLDIIYFSETIGNIRNKYFTYIYNI